MDTGLQLVVYIGLVGAAVLGGAVAYWMGHRALTCWIGLVAGVVIFVWAETSVSDTSLNADISRKLLAEYSAVAFAVLYSAGFVLGWLLMKRSGRRRQRAAA